MFSSRARKIRKDPSEDPSEDPEVDAMNEVAGDEVIEVDDGECSDKPIEVPDESAEDPLEPGRLLDPPPPGWAPSYRKKPYEYKVKKDGTFFICGEEDHKKACAEFLDWKEKTEKRKFYDAKKKEIARSRADYQTVFEMHLLLQGGHICKKHK